MRHLRLRTTLNVSRSYNARHSATLTLLIFIESPLGQHRPALPLRFLGAPAGGLALFCLAPELAAVLLSVEAEPEAFLLDLCFLWPT